MASFRTHAFIGAAAGAFSAAILISKHHLTIPQGILFSTLAFTGSVLPDFDSNTGKGVRFLFESLAVIASVGILTRLEIRNVEIGALVMLGTYLLVRYPGLYLFEKCSEHRGAFHSLPAGWIAAMAVILLFHTSFPMVRLWFGAAALGGYYLHLFTDEIWSAGVFGIGAKKSLGTAFKLTGENLFSTILLWLMTLILTGCAAWTLFGPLRNGSF